MVAAFCWLLISTILLTIPGTSFPKENWLSKIWFDKWVHIAMFSVMVVLWYGAIQKKPPPGSKLKKVIVLTGVFSLLYGIGMEFVQEYLVVNRFFDSGDIIADAVGCTIGVLYCMRKGIKKN